MFGSRRSKTDDLGVLLNEPIEFHPVFVILRGGVMTYGLLYSMLMPLIASRLREQRLGQRRQQLLGRIRF